MLVDAASKGSLKQGVDARDVLTNLIRGGHFPRFFWDTLL
jgi:hypothetical protein